MEVRNAILPNEEQLLRMAEEGPEGPIYLLNLLKYKDHAEYEDRRETSLTGQEAYAIYGMGVFRLMQDFGGYVGIAAPVTELMVGEVGELWDSVTIGCQSDCKGHQP
ncbi:MAG: DUF1330 domain-containing protein [Pseudomonadota bacterium]